VLKYRDNSVVGPSDLLENCVRTTVQCSPNRFCNSQDDVFLVSPVGRDGGFSVFERLGGIPTPFHGEVEDE
jgi:hypothetical protein